jgi:hypothetical protein
MYRTVSRQASQYWKREGGEGMVACSATNGITTYMDANKKHQTNMVRGKPMKRVLSRERSTGTPYWERCETCESPLYDTTTCGAR